MKREQRDTQIQSDRFASGLGAGRIQPAKRILCDQRR